MSKSKGQTFTLDTITEAGFSPLAFRYLILQSHYRQKLNFTWEAIEASQNALNKLKKQISNLKKNEVEEISENYLNKFKSELDNDLNTAQALGTLWEMMKDDSLSDNIKYWTANKMDEVFSLDLGKAETQKEITPEIQNLIDRRNTLRSEKNWGEADKIRNELVILGYEVKD